MLSKQVLRFNNVLIKRNIGFSSVLRNKQVWNSENVISSPFKDVDIPNMTGYEYVWRILDTCPTKIATVCGITNRSYTYEEIYKQTRRLGANLRKKFKIVDGDVVGIMATNSPEYPAIVLGILGAGAIATTFNPVYTAHEVQRQIQLSDTKLMIVQPDLVATVKKALSLANKDVPVIAIDILEKRSEGTISYKELIEDVHVDLSILREVKRSADDTCFLPYSSGTTGLPKGVELTNRNLVANSEQQNTECRFFLPTTETHQDAVIVLMPFFHSYGLCMLLFHKLSVGLKLVTLPKFQPDTFLNTMLQYKINLLYVVPPIALFLGSDPNVTSKHMEHLRRINCGAAPLPFADIDRILKKVKHNLHFGQGYGLTETSPLVSIAPLDCNEYHTAGYAVPNVQLRVVDENLKNLGPGKVGELLIKGPNVMKGYKNNPDANKEVFVDGWFRSGDLVSIDERGLLTIVERLKELIKVNAYQVPPAELESVLREHPAIFDAAIAGVPDPKTGEKPKAFVVLKDGVKITDEDIISFVSERVAPYKRIKEVMFIHDIPKNPSGKILRRVLKEKYC